MELGDGAFADRAVGPGDRLVFNLEVAPSSSAQRRDVAESDVRNRRDSSSIFRQDRFSTSPDSPRNTVRGISSSVASMSQRRSNSFPTRGQFGPVDSKMA